MLMGKVLEILHTIGMSLTRYPENRDAEDYTY